MTTSFIVLVTCKLCKWKWHKRDFYPKEIIEKHLFTKKITAKIFIRGKGYIIWRIIFLLLPLFSLIRRTRKTRFKLYHLWLIIYPSVFCFVTQIYGAYIFAKLRGKCKKEKKSNIWHRCMLGRGLLCTFRKVNKDVNYKAHEDQTVHLTNSSPQNTPGALTFLLIIFELLSIFFINIFRKCCEHFSSTFFGSVANIFLINIFRKFANIFCQHFLEVLPTFFLNIFLSLPTLLQNVPTFFGPTF
jgi:hypothetical protein